VATSDTSFFRSRKNLVGMIIAVLVVGLHLVVGLGVLWPVVALAGWGAGVALTPGRQQPELPPAPARPSAEELRDRIRHETHWLYGSGPAHEVVDSMAALKVSLDDVLAEWDRLADVPEQRVVVETIVNDYLPGTLGRYLAVSDRTHPTAVTETAESLTILREEVERIREAVVSDTLRDLEDQTRALRIQFGRLPGAGYDTES
jgi:hypothetical protein